jgi:hypothetical protein
MEKSELDHLFLKNNCPKAWKDFEDFYASEYSSNEFLRNTEFINLPFEMQIGVFIKYFTDNGIEIDLSNSDLSILPDNVVEAFKIHENVISHYS